MTQQNKPNGLVTNLDWLLYAFAVFATLTLGQVILGIGAAVGSIASAIFLLKKDRNPEGAAKTKHLVCLYVASATLVLAIVAIFLLVILLGSIFDTTGNFLLNHVFCIDTGCPPN